ncbi:MAG: PLP-dependent transferase [bacterium]
MNETYLKHIPFAQPVPDTMHAVCCSLPTMKHIIDYEEKTPQILDAIQVGYPRFVLHQTVRQAICHATDKHHRAGQAAYALVSLQAARQMENFVKTESFSITPEAGFFLVTFPHDEKACQRADAFLQHTGLRISSRQAEDYLLSAGRIPALQEETIMEMGAENHVLDVLRRYIDSRFIRLANSGMNAFYAAFQAVRKLQRPKGKTVYLQLGWLYLDTQKILQAFLEPDERVVSQFDVFDKRAIERIFEQYGDSIAAVVTELPTNPLVQTLDVVHLGQLAQRHDVVRIFDPTVSSIVNVNLLPWTDVLTTSLTKYASHCGDVMIGAVALNEDAPYYRDLSDLIPQELEKPYPRNVQRLAGQIRDLPRVVAAINANTVRLVAWLNHHPMIRRVHWAYADASQQNYNRVATGEQCPGALVTIELNKPLSEFFDRVPVVKAPSFGNFFTMMCPFIYMAHYDLVSNRQGRQLLRSLGLDPDLVRVSVGTEPIEAIIRAIETGLSA